LKDGISGERGEIMACGSECREFRDVKEGHYGKGRVSRRSAEYGRIAKPRICTNEYAELSLGAYW
jgi:hypothetical protein